MGVTPAKKVDTRGSGKYQRLQEYFSRSKKRVETLTYADLERIIEGKLPQSAYHHRPWWVNSGHPLSKTWTNVGWKVKSVKLGESIIFKKTF
jgi:hypothetical protein